MMKNIKGQVNVLQNIKGNIKETVGYSKAYIVELLEGKADKSTTLAGYGITDAYTKEEVNSKLNAEIHEYVDEQNEIIKTDIAGLQTQLNEESHFRGYLSTNAKIQTLDATPNDFAYSAESGTKWVYDADNGWQDTGTPVPDQLTPASDITPLVNGVASIGQANEYARGDHRHPTDTSRVGVDEFNLLKQDINNGLDNIIAIQEHLIGGGS